MKFGQSTEHSMRNICYEKSWTKCGGETIPRPFSKKSKLIVSLDQWSKFLNIWFLFMPSCGLSKGTDNKSQTSCFT